jgi:nucleoside-diphosphate-sugar epimerase
MSRIIALTGATGFIGGALAHRLHAEHWQIRALARPSSKRDHLSDINVQWIEGDLNDPESLRRLGASIFFTPSSCFASMLVGTPFDESQQDRSLVIDP